VGGKAAFSTPNGTLRNGDEARRIKILGKEAANLAGSAESKNIVGAGNLLLQKVPTQRRGGLLKTKYSIDGTGGINTEHTGKQRRGEVEFEC